MSGNNELNRRRFLRSIASTGAVAGAFLTDHLGPLDGGLLRGEAQAAQRGPGDVGGQHGFGSVAVESQNLLLGFTVEDTGIALTQIRNKTTGFEHLSKLSPLFEFQDEEGSALCRSNQGVSVDRVVVSADHTELKISGRAKELPLGFTLRVGASKEEGTILVGLEITNRRSDRFPVRAVVPYIEGLVTTGRHGAMWGAIPQEIGTVVPLGKRGPSIGMELNPRVGLPTSMNTMGL